MLESLRTSSNGMLAQQRRVEVLANNLANAATHGFKRALVVQTARAGQTGAARGTTVGTAVDLRPGPLQRTDNPLHVGIVGEGFFAVRTPAGERYTRLGAFRVDAASRLVDPSGNPVQGEGGEIVLPAGTPAISTDGVVEVDGQRVDQIRLIAFERPRSLRLEGGVLFRAGSGASPVDVEPKDIRLSTGHLEGSNVDPIEELVALIAAQRIFEAGQKALTTTDDTLRRTVNDVPRVDS